MSTPSPGPRLRRAHGEPAPAVGRCRSDRPADHTRPGRHFQRPEGHARAAHVGRVLHRNRLDAGQPLAAVYRPPSRRGAGGRLRRAGFGRFRSWRALFPHRLLLARPEVRRRSAGQQDGGRAPVRPQTLDAADPGSRGAVGAGRAGGVHRLGAERQLRPPGQPGLPRHPGHGPAPRGDAVRRRRHGVAEQRHPAAERQDPGGRPRPATVHAERADRSETHPGDGAQPARRAAEPGRQVGGVFRGLRHGGAERHVRPADRRRRGPEARLVRVLPVARLRQPAVHPTDAERRHPHRVALRPGNCRLAPAAELGGEGAVGRLAGVAGRPEGGLPKNK